MRRVQCSSLGLALLAACGVAASGLVACSGAGSDSASSRDSALPIVAAPTPSPGDTTCPDTGLWARCSVIKRIERAGLNAHADSAKDVTESPLAISGFEIPVSRGHVRVFLYADSLSRKRDELKLDRQRFVRPNQEPTMRRRTIVASANLLVLMDVLNSQNRERIANALMAGPPQPPSKQP